MLISAFSLSLFLFYFSQDIITADFCHHYLHFSPTSIVLKLPCGVALDLLRYWDCQPVRFVCCARARPGERADGLAWGRVFFCVALECGDGDEDEDDGDEDDGEDAESVEKAY